MRDYKILIASFASTCQGHRPVGVHAVWVECHGSSVEHAPTKMSRLCHASGSLRAAASWFTRCTWNLKPPCIIERDSYAAVSTCRCGQIPGGNEPKMWRREANRTWWAARGAGASPNSWKMAPISCSWLPSWEKTTYLRLLSGFQI